MRWKEYMSYFINRTIKCIRFMNYWGKFMSSWICQRCNRVYSYWVSECRKCNSMIGESIKKDSSACSICPICRTGYSFPHGCLQEERNFKVNQGRIYG